MLLDETSTTNASMGLRVQGVPYSERLQRTEETLEFLGLSDRASIPYPLPFRRREAALRHCSCPRHAPAADSCDEPNGNLDSHNSAKVIEISAAH